MEGIEGAWWTEDNGSNHGLARGVGLLQGMKHLSYFRGDLDAVRGRGEGGWMFGAGRGSADLCLGQLFQGTGPVISNCRLAQVGQIG